MAMPSIVAGIRTVTLRRSKTPHQALSATTSITIMIGSMIAAASSGGMTSDINGMPRAEMPPPKPPFAKPTMRTAGIAAA